MASTSFKHIMTLFLVFTSTVHGYQQLNAIQQIANRNPYYGGYALPESNLGCPATTETCPGQFCCPVGTWCGPTSNGAYCCPTNEDCYTQVNDLPTCADPSWTLFDDVYPWCCTKGQIGVYGQVCVDPTVAYSSSDYAATETQANTAKPPATRASVSVAGGAATSGSGSGSAATTTNSKASGNTETGSPSSSSSPTATSKSSDASSLKGYTGMLLMQVLALGIVMGGMR